MSLLFRVLHAVYSRGTHHKLVLDGLQRLDGTHAEGWQRLFLKHHEMLLAGAKAPDTEFKDFTNHVLHPRDGFWGGAAETARLWYGKLVEAAARQDWPQVAWSAGVLSHYVTDPVQPFHTAQSEAESSIHRAFEWSISNAYAPLAEIGRQSKIAPPAIPDTDNWLEVMIADAAREATVHYEKLIAHFDIHRAVVDPPTGLDLVARRILGVQIERAAALYAIILRRALADAQVAPPDVSLSLDTLLALIKVPAKMWLKRLDNVADRAEVERMYDELKTTGTVEATLPQEQRVVRAAYAAEVLSTRPVTDMAARYPVPARRATPVPASVPAARPVAEKKSEPVAEAIDPPARELPLAEPPRPAPLAADQRQPAEPVGPPQPVAVAAPEPAERPHVSVPSIVPAASDPASDPAPGPVQAPVAELAPDGDPFSTPAPAPTLAPTLAPAAIAALADLGPPEAASPRVVAARPDATRSGGVRLYLTPAQDIVDAPSIGPRMAERLAPLGLKTVADLLAANPLATAMSLGQRGIDADTVRDWQDQALLVCSIPGLRGTHAQLLVGAGYRTSGAIANAEPDVLCAAVLAFAASGDGQRVLRNGDSPDIERIKSWAENARAARAA